MGVRALAVLPEPRPVDSRRSVDCRHDGDQRRVRVCVCGESGRVAKCEKQKQKQKQFRSDYYSIIFVCKSIPHMDYHV